MNKVEIDLFEYLELFYNRKHLHATLAYLKPNTISYVNVNAKIGPKVYGHSFDPYAVINPILLLIQVG